MYNKAKFAIVNKILEGFLIEKKKFQIVKFYSLPWFNMYKYIWEQRIV